MCVEYTGLVDGFKVFSFHIIHVYTLGETYAGIAAVDYCDRNCIHILVSFFGKLFTLT